MLFPSLSALAACAGLLLSSNAHASTLTPGVLPLTVRNPYFSTWLTNAREEPWTKWPIFWTGSDMGMSIMVAVKESEVAYPLLGRPQDSLEKDKRLAGYSVAYPKYHGANFDASATNFTYSIPGPSDDSSAELTISFLSPITPESTLRQSIPASYIAFHVKGDFDIELYMDVNGDWLSGDPNVNIEWYMQDLEFEEHGSLKSWQIQREEDLIFTENADHAEWGKLHFSAPSDVNFQCGSSEEVRTHFAKHGSLDNSCKQEFRSIKDNEPVFAFHKSFKLGSDKNSKADHTLFTLAHIQDEVVQYASARGLTFMRPMWKSWFFSEYSLLMFHYSDYANVLKLAGNYSAQLAHDAYRAAGKEYVDIVALSARQVLGATSFSGTPDAPLIFLKEISSNGNTQTVDVIFPSWPFFVYTNPRWLAYLLEPLLEHQLSGQYPNKYSMHDLGPNFPNLTGHADGNDEYMPVEECGDMLIMGLSLVNSLRYTVSEAASSIWSSLGPLDSSTESENDDEGAYPFPLHYPSVSTAQSQDLMYGIDERWGGGARGTNLARKWLNRSYRIWAQWTEYLIDESLYPANQLCTDDFAGWLPLQTNLALKGIVGIKAMSELSSVLDHSHNAADYRKISSNYITEWQKLGMTRDGNHAKLSYDWYGSWTTLYSLFADSMLCFHPDAADRHGKSETEDSRNARDLAQTPLFGRPVPSKDSKSSNFIPDGLYANHSAFYINALQKYGLPLDSRHLYAKSDWVMQVAAISSPALQKELVSRLGRWLDETSTNKPFSDLWETEGDGGFGAGNQFAARPVVGSHFGILALERACLF